MTAVLALASGEIFEGESIGAAAVAIGEACFNTSLCGYQEIVTDPSYAGQIVCLTYPEIGNYGVNAADAQAAGPMAAGLVVRCASADPSSWRSEGALGVYLAAAKIPGIVGIDTRALVRILRGRGAQMAALATDGTSARELQKRAAAAPGLTGRDLASEVSCREIYEVPAVGEMKKRVGLIDFGAKRGILRQLALTGCTVTVFPSNTKASDLMSRGLDGVMLSNGPGDPAAVVGAAQTVEKLVGQVPLFGICLGQQILALALGGSTYKLKFGHRGGNHPVREIATGRVDITSQNHGFAVDAKSLEGKARITHVNLNDDTVEGLEVPGARAFAVQYHPEASPGPHDARHLFQRFLRMMETP